jgi:argininosuccinate lyase
LTPGALFFASARFGPVSGLERAIQKNPTLIYQTDVLTRRTALQHAAASCVSGVDVVKWLLEKGVPWRASHNGDDIAEDLARKSGQEEKRKVLREWAINQGESQFIRG